MNSLSRNLLAPLLSLALLMLGNGFFQTYISVRLKEDQFTAMTIGLVQAAYYAGFMIGALKIEGMIGRIRHIRAFAMFSCILTATIMLQGIIYGAVSWTILRFLGGLCTASLYVVIESWLLTVSPSHKRGTTLAFYMISLYSAQALCQFFIDMVEVQSAIPFMIAGMLCSLSIFPVTFTRTAAPEVSDHPSVSIFKMFKLAPFGCFGCMFSGMLLGGIYTFTPIYAQETKIAISLIMFTTIAGGFLLQWPLGFLSDLFDRRKILLFVSMLLTAPSVAILFFTSNLPYVLALSFLIGGLTFTIYPLGISQVVDRFHNENVTSVTGGLLLVYSFGSVVGPLLAPLFIDFAPPFGIYVYTASVAAMLAIVGMYSLARFKPVPVEEQGEFVPIQPKTTTAAELDPRTQDEENEDEDEEKTDTPDALNKPSEESPQSTRGTLEADPT